MQKLERSPDAKELTGLFDKLSKEISELDETNSLLLGKQDFGIERVANICANYCGQFQIGFMEHDAVFEIFKLPPGISPAIAFEFEVQSQIDQKTELKHDYKEKLMESLKVVIKDYFISDEEHLNKYYENPFNKIMQTDRVIPYAYIQRRFLSTLNTSVKIKKSRIKPNDVFKEFLFNLCKEGFLVELKPEHKLKYETSAKLYGYVGEVK